MDAFRAGGRPRAPGDALLSEVVTRDRVRVLVLLGVSLLGVATALVLPDALAAAVDTAVAGDTGSGALLWFLAVGAAEIAAEVLLAVLTARVTATACARLRGRLTAHLTRLGTGHRFPDGDVVSRVTTDCAGAGAVASVTVQLGSALLVAVGAIVLLGVLDWRLAVVFVCSVPVALWLARSHLRRTASDVGTYQEVSGELSARLLDAVTGARTIAASGLADRETARVIEPLPRLSGAGAGMWRTQARMVWRAGLLLPAVQVAVLTAAGFGVAAGRLSVGDVLAALGYVALGMSLVSQIPLLTSLSRARSCAARIAEVLDSPTGDGREPGTAPPCPSGTLRVRDVGVDGVFRGVCLDPEPGTTVAVVGRSGVGKSALAAVLGGLHTPDEGEVLLDGVPMARVPEAVLRDRVAVAFERPALLGATVADAVGYGHDPGGDVLERACRTAGIHDLVERLPDGYATPMTDTPLSGGEAQRLGLARALTRNPGVLILDGATAGLDTVTEARVHAAVTAALPGTTVVLVTHRAGAAARADSVVWLDHGGVRAVDTHAALWSDADYRAVFAEAGAA
ncbi:ABC transporter ATP-binding protein [Saccharomonospora iraqiensis]|uniref:ABC transporter ATP-binding protein n=1 Tax=Saccharomonospora iraqiensis TaxID=52698 RepID=UPI00022DF903|nr:ABC transporter ATP-binding protein [Saccharomonospora iraqiensis]